MRKWMWLGVFAVCALAGASDKVEAATAGCTTSLADCYYRAANVDSFWYRWATGIDCELDYVECVRGKLFGA